MHQLLAVHVTTITQRADHFCPFFLLIFNGDVSLLACVTFGPHAFKLLERLASTNNTTTTDLKMSSFFRAPTHPPLSLIPVTFSACALVVCARALACVCIRVVRGYIYIVDRVKRGVFPIVGEIQRCWVVQ